MACSWRLPRVRFLITAVLTAAIYPCLSMADDGPSTATQPSRRVIHEVKGIFVRASISQARNMIAAEYWDKYPPTRGWIDVIDVGKGSYSRIDGTPWTTAEFFNKGRSLYVFPSVGLRKLTASGYVIDVDTMQKTDMAVLNGRHVGSADKVGIAVLGGENKLEIYGTGQPEDAAYVAKLIAPGPNSPYLLGFSKDRIFCSGATVEEPFVTMLIDRSTRKVMGQYVADRCPVGEDSIRPRQLGKEYFAMVLGPGLWCVADLASGARLYEVGKLSREPVDGDYPYPRIDIIAGIDYVDKSGRISWREIQQGTGVVSLLSCDAKSGKERRRAVIESGSSKEIGVTKIGKQWYVWHTCHDKKARSMNLELYSIDSMAMVGKLSLHEEAKLLAVLGDAAIVAGEKSIVAHSLLGYVRPSQSTSRPGQER